MSKSLTVYRDRPTDEENERILTRCEYVLDNWRHCMRLAVIIAAKVREKREDAAIWLQGSQDMQYRIEEAHHHINKALGIQAAASDDTA